MSTLIVFGGVHLFVRKIELELRKKTNLVLGPNLAAFLSVLCYQSGKIKGLQVTISKEGNRIGEILKCRVICSGMQKCRFLQPKELHPIQLVALSPRTF
jgi:hypothetical protein